METEQLDFDSLCELFARKPDLVLSFAEFAIHNCSLSDLAVLALREVSRLPQPALHLSQYLRCALQQQQQQQQDNQHQQPFTLLARRLSKAVGTSRIKRVTG